MLDGFETLKICVGYDLDGRRLDYLPTAAEEQARCVPVYEEMPGWQEDITQARSADELPVKARNYVKRIEELTETPVMLLSVGPDRAETMLLRNPFEK